MNENAFKEGLKGIQYVKMEAPYVKMPAYNIKSGKIRVKTSE